MEVKTLQMPCNLALCALTRVAAMGSTNLLYLNQYYFEYNENFIFNFKFPLFLKFINVFSLRQIQVAIVNNLTAPKSKTRKDFYNKKTTLLKYCQVGLLETNQNVTEEK